MHTFTDNARWLIRYYKPFKKRVIIIISLSISSAALSTAIPLVYIRIIDGIRNDVSYEYLVKSALLFFLLGVLSSTSGFLGAAQRAKTNLQLQWAFRQTVFSHIIRLDQSFLDTYRLGDVVTRLTDDVGDKLCWFSCSGIFRALGSALLILFCLGAMFYIHPLLALLALIPYPLQLVIHFTSTDVLDKRFRNLQNMISHVNQVIETCFSGIRIVQAYCMENQQALRFANAADQRAKAEISAEKSHIFVHQLYAYFWQIGQVIVLMAGGWMVMNQQITIGEFVAFDQYIVFLVWPIFDIGGLLVGYRRAAVSIRRLCEFEAFQPKIVAPDEPCTPASRIGRIECSDVYLNRCDQDVLSRISFDTSHHRMIAIVGGVGAGKTTLLEMICRFHDPSHGVIKLDGIPLTVQDPSAIRRRIAYISQEPLLFTDTIRNNIRFGRQWITEEAVEQAIDVAQLRNEVNRFPNGMDTLIGLRGITLSGGQKQRIAIARAIAEKPDILVLDDATAHLDADTEKDLWEQIYRFLPSIRVIVVTHRTDILEKADWVLVMKNGALVEEGHHSKLKALNGEYARIYTRQLYAETIRGD
ncbi:ABC transporter ATP-binding protein [bacterium]|nr:ABC transporter ATP-binding protein [candidate division CSSED10-310 bacterium]